MAASEDGTGPASENEDTTSQGPDTINFCLGKLQTDEQRAILDTVSQIRKCGLDSILSLPQIVVCGDHSSGKSSVLEALTGIPFPRNDNLCTRFATEIRLRRESVSSLTIRVIPDGNRPQSEQDTIKAFSESITNYEDLPAIMEQAMKAMGISDMDASGSAFAKDTFSIEIQGPDRPQLTLVDIPGLIQASTKGVSEADVAMVAEITDSYIKQPRTICLAVVAATDDAANQPILQRVRKFDPDGERTLGVITKPDILGAGSGIKFLELARNENIFFTLGWHVVKNSRSDEPEFSIEERNLYEKMFFSTSNFKTLPKEHVGIDTLRVRLSHLLFEHVRKELPRLQDDLENVLNIAQNELHLLGESRSTAMECRAFLARLNMECYKICQAGLQGNYDNDYFKVGAGLDEEFSLNESSTIRRIRAAIQYANTTFADEFRKKGHKYQIHFNTSETDVGAIIGRPWPWAQPRIVEKKETLQWVRKMLLRSRGRELGGNFNPHLIAELFWEQSDPWEKLAKTHIQQVSKLCEKFLNNLLDKIAPENLKTRIWSELVQDTLKCRREAAFGELDKLLQDRKDFPINDNNYYTVTVHKKNQDRIKDQIERHVPDYLHQVTRGCNLGYHYDKINVHDELQKIIRHWADEATPDTEEFSCEEALDCLMTIYKVQQKTFIANMATQVIERHIVRGLHEIFSPMVAINMSETKVQSIVSEPSATKRLRKFWTDRVKKLEEGQEIFHDALNR